MSLEVGNMFQHCQLPDAAENDDPEEGWAAKAANVG